MQPAYSECIQQSNLNFFFVMTNNHSDKILRSHSYSFAELQKEILTVNQYNFLYKTFFPEFWMKVFILMMCDMIFLQVSLC